MEISQYIAQYLLRNKYCYIHGLGNLEIVKSPGQYNNGELSSGQYNVVLNNSGSIDDAFANFVANNEQISIAKASNNIREFSSQAKATLSAGQEVEVPGIGRFKQHAGQIQFLADAGFTYSPAAIPILKAARQVEEKPLFNTYKNESLAEVETSRSSSGFIWRILIGLLLMAILAGAVYFFIQHQNNKRTQTATTDSTVDTALRTMPVTPVVDTLNANDTTTQTVVTPAATTMPTSGTAALNVIINEYPTAALANKRADKLKSFGNPTSVISKDSATHYVVIAVNAALSDSTHVLDSLRRQFNPKGVRLYP